MIDILRETPISLIDVARRLDVKVRTVRNWTKRAVNPLAVEKFGGKLVTTLEELQRFGRRGMGGSATSKTRHPRPTAPTAAGKHLKEVHGL